MLEQVKKVREPHPDVGCWWTLYDYGLDTIKTWDKEYVHPYPGTSLQSCAVLRFMGSW